MTSHAINKNNIFTSICIANIYYHSPSAVEHGFSLQHVIQKCQNTKKEKHNNNKNRTLDTRIIQTVTIYNSRYTAINTNLAIHVITIPLFLCFICAGMSCAGKSCAGKSCAGQSCAGMSCAGKSRAGQSVYHGGLHYYNLYALIFTAAAAGVV